MRSRADSRSLALTAGLLAMGCALGLIEATLMPPMPVPGLKLGLANLAVVIALAAVGPARALVVSIGRVLVVGLATGTLAGPAGVLSLAGAFAAWMAMVGASRACRGLSVIGWSLAGSSAHVVGQLVVACLLAGAAAPLFLAPVSLTLGLASGLALGYSARLLLSRVPSLQLRYA